MSHFKIKALFVWEEDPDESHLGMEEQDTSNSTNVQTILKELRDFCHENSTELCEIKGKIVKMSKGMDHTEKKNYRSRRKNIDTHASWLEARLMTKKEGRVVKEFTE